MINDRILEAQCAELLASLPLRAGAATPAAARVGHALLADLLSGPPAAVAAVEGLVVPAAADGPAQPMLAVRRYIPRPGTTRALVYLHGGGWVIGTLDSYDVLCRALAVACDAQVFSVDYRLSPEARYPCAIDDTVRAWHFVRARAVEFGIDPARIALAGDSAGGYLAVTAARWLKRDRAPLPAALALIYPVADRRMNSESVRLFGEGYYLTSETMEWFWQQFLGAGAPPADHPDLSPVLADDLAGLPPAFVMTAGCDILRDEGESLAQRLRNAGVPVHAQRVPGVIHGFIRFRARVQLAHQSLADLAAWLEHSMS